MAVDNASLVTRFPEFTDTPGTLVAASIVDAELMIDRVYYGAKADMAVTYLAAHYIAMNPLGEMARIKKNGHTSTVYEQLYKSVKRSLGAGCRVI